MRSHIAALFWPPPACHLMVTKGLLQHQPSSFCFRQRKKGRRRHIPADSYLCPLDRTGPMGTASSKNKGEMGLSKYICTVYHRAVLRHKKSTWSVSISLVSHLESSSPTQGCIPGDSRLYFLSLLLQFHCNVQ